MDKLEFVDTHVHFWDMQHPDLFYAHFQPDFDHPMLGTKLRRLGESNYQAGDYIAETRSAGVTKAVHLQAAVGSKDPVKETEWLQAAADRTGFPQAIVGHADLKDPRVEGELERHCAYANMRGVRDFSEGDYLVDQAFHRGFALLEKFNLVSSIDVRWQNMGKMRDLAFKFPNIRMVVDHAGIPQERTEEYFNNWRGGVNTVAAAENVVCKISGLSMGDNDWTVESIRPWVLHCIEAFGPERCVFGTNWPIDSLFSTYDAVVDAYTEIIGDFSEDEKVAMFSGNAEKLYNI